MTDSLRDKLRALAVRGTGMDLNPTRLHMDPDADTWWCSYLSRLDDQWRARIVEILDAEQDETADARMLAARVYIAHSLVSEDVRAKYGDDVADYVASSLHDHADTAYLLVAPSDACGRGPCWLSAGHDGGCQPGPGAPSVAPDPGCVAHLSAGQCQGCGPDDCAYAPAVSPGADAADRYLDAMEHCGDAVLERPGEREGGVIRFAPGEVYLDQETGTFHRQDAPEGQPVLDGPSLGDYWPADPSCPSPEGQPEGSVCCGYAPATDPASGLLRPECCVHGELAGGYFKAEVARRVYDEHVSAPAPVPDPVCTCPRLDGYRIKRRGCPVHAEKDADYWRSQDAPVPDDEATALAKVINRECSKVGHRDPVSVPSPHALARELLAAGYVSPEAHAAAVQEAVQAHGDRIAEEIEEACPHEPDEHPEGCCEVCDLAFAATAIVRDLTREAVGE